MTTLSLVWSQSAVRNGSTVELDSVTKLTIDPATILNYVRSGDDLLVVARDTKTLCVEGFFNPDPAHTPHLVLAHWGNEWPIGAMPKPYPAETNPIASIDVQVLNARHILAAYGLDALRAAITAATRTVSRILEEASIVATLALPEHEAHKQHHAAHDHLIRFDVRIGSTSDASSLAYRILCALAIESVIFGEQEVLIAPAVEIFPFTTVGAGSTISGLSEPTQVQRPFSGTPVLAESGWSRQYRDDMKAVTELFGHLRADRLVLAHQAIRENSKSETTLYDECLLRVVDREGVAQSCAGQITLLERLGLIRALDDHVVGLAIQQLRADRNLRLGVNVSGQSACLDEWWTQRLMEFKADRSLAERLTIELTETADFPSQADAVAFAQRLQKLGCTLALDDLGTGEHTLRDLFELNPDVVKVDAHFLRWARQSRRGWAALKSMVDLSLAIGRNVVVEGVETLSDSNIASEVGAQWQQGYFIERPRCETDHVRASGYVPRFDTGAKLSLRQTDLVRDFMLSRLDGNFNSSELAAIAGLSRTAFFDRFARTMQQTPRQYLQGLRVERAKQLLKSSELSLSEVSTACGFFDQTHMTRIFKRLVNATPGRYRNELFEIPSG